MLRTVVLALSPSPSPRGRGEPEKPSKSLYLGRGLREHVTFATEYLYTWLKSLVYRRFSDLLPQG
jgi:hypothetical protein